MLKTYKGLKQLKEMNIEELKKLALSIREEIINGVSKNGGHIAPSLGVVELSIALHYVFNSPLDSIVWDVGHQAYAHKILTLRKLDKLRKKNGISGFPKPQESEHDKFIAGHSGVSISQALAMALLKPEHKAIAVIGDGSMTSGIAYEALNHAGSLKPKNLIIVLNDNEMSISKNVGALSGFLNTIVNNTYYQKIKSEIKNLISSIPFQKTLHIDLLSFIDKLRHSALNIIAPEYFFKTFGFRYVGPIDGHDIEVLIKFFSSIPEQDLNTPLLFHVVTKKGKGYDFAETNPCQFHGISAFNKKNGILSKTSSALSYTEVFANTLLELAKKDAKVCAITAAMTEGTGLSNFAKEFPDRFYDVGIAEQHAVCFSVGLAKAGAYPFVAIYSTFMQRAVDQVIHDVALNKLPLILCMDRAGIVGEDGATHHGIFDLSLFRHIPNLTIMAPSSANELKNMMLSYSKQTNPCLIRYPRACVPEWESAYVFEDIKEAKARLVFKKNITKKYISIFSIGSMVYTSILAATKFIENKKDFGVKVYDFRFIKPIDVDLILKEASKSSAILSTEDSALSGGFASLVFETIIDNKVKLNIPFKRLGVADEFIEQGSQDELKTMAGINYENIFEALEEIYTELKKV